MSWTGNATCCKIYTTGPATSILLSYGDFWNGYDMLYECPNCFYNAKNRNSSRSKIWTMLINKNLIEEYNRQRR